MPALPAPDPHPPPGHLMPSTSDAVPNVRRWLPALYPLAIVLCLVPFIEAVSGLWPPQLGSPTWRFGAAGLFLSFISSSVLAVLIIIAVAHALGHRGIARAMGVVSVLFALWMVVLCAAFTLDTLQVRTIVRSAAQHGFQLAAAKAMITALVVIVAFIALAIAGFKTSGVPGGNPRSKRRGAPGPGLVVGGERVNPTGQERPGGQRGSR